MFYNLSLKCTIYITHDSLKSIIGLKIINLQLFGLSREGRKDARFFIKPNKQLFYS